MTDRGGGGGSFFPSESDTFKSGIFGEFSKSEENGTDAATAPSNSWYEAMKV